MELFIIDNIISIIQVFAIAAVINYSVEGTKAQREKFAILAYILCTSLYLILSNGIFSEILIYILSVFLCIVIYKEKRNRAILSFCIIYVADMILATITMLIYAMYNRYGVEFFHISGLYFFYCLQAVIQYIIVKFKYKIKLFCNIIDNYTRLLKIIICIISFSMTLAVRIMSEITDVFDTSVKVDILFICFFITVLISIIYIVKVKIQSKSIEILNMELQKKNNTLRKIKHDYGAQISYLYGLYLLRRYDELESELSKIQEVNKNTVSAVEIGGINNTVLSGAIKQTLNNGIHVIAHENADYDNVKMKKDQIVNLAVNVINSELKFLEKSSVISVDTYNSLGSVIIDIKNKNLESDLMILEELFKNKINLWDTFAKRKSMLKDLKRSIRIEYENKAKVKVFFKDLTREIKVRLIIK